jgi:lipopolysaccharide export system permease protein
MSMPGLSGPFSAYNRAGKLMFFLKTIDRYILAELLKPFVAGVVAFLIIMISNTLYIFMELIVKNNIDGWTVTQMLLYSLPAIVVVTLPVAYMFATLLALGRLGRDSEIIALRACGVSLTRCIAPVIIVSLLISGVGYWLNESVVPWANRQTVEVIKVMLRKKPLQAVKAKQFLNSDKRNFYVGEVDREQGILSEMYVIDQSKGGFPQLIQAEKAVRKDTKWELRDGIVRKLDTQGYIDHEIRFKRMEIEMNINSDSVFPNQLDVRQLASGDARKLIEDKRAQGQNTNRDEVDYHNKFSLPLATFFTILLAAPIGIRFSKMGNYFGVAISIALVFIWYVTYSMFSNLGITGQVPPFLAAWVQNLAFGGVGLILLVQMQGVNLLWPVQMLGKLLWLPFALILKPFRRRKLPGPPPQAG